MKVWIELANAPHCLFFYPVKKKLMELGCEIVVTYRSYGYTSALVRKLYSDVNCWRIGRHEKTLKGKLISYARRVRDLSSLISKVNPDVLLTKASPDATRVAFGLGIPSIVIYDNDKNPHQCKLTFPLADRVILPECFPAEKAVEYGARMENIRAIKGVLEVNHLDVTFENRLPTRVQRALESENSRVIAMRDSPNSSSYCSVSIGRVLCEAAEKISKSIGKAVFIMFPRERTYLSRINGNIIVPRRVVNTIQLFRRIDLMIGGGGAMTREAALVGAPTISCYPMEQVAPTRELANRGLIEECRVDPKEIVDVGLEIIDEKPEYAERASRYLRECGKPSEAIIEEVFKLV